MIPKIIKIKTNILYEKYCFLLLISIESGKNFEHIKANIRESIKSKAGSLVLNS